jgi:hypothetical protein
VPKPRFILRYRGDGDIPESDAAQVRELADADVVGESSKMLLVESEPEALRALVDTLPDWIMAPEQQYGVPDTRKQVTGPPSSPSGGKRG